MASLVSILIPAYNAEPWIAETIRSALGQTWPHKEIIIVDDGSKDGTVAVAQRFAPEGVRVVRQQNQGASAARNTAFSLCQGDYIQWLDADDLLAANKIELQMAEVAKVGDARRLISSPWAHFIFRPHKAEFIETGLWKNLSPVEWLLLKMGRCFHMQPASWMVSRELTEAAGPWDTRLTLDDDGEYFCRVILQSTGTHFVPEAKTYYRSSGPGSLHTIDQTSKKLDSLFLSMQLHVRYLRSLEHSARTREACLAYLQFWFPYFHPARPDIMEKLHAMAGELEGLIAEPSISWKYRWISSIFGWPAARSVADAYNSVKFRASRRWDLALYRLEGGGRLSSQDREKIN